MTWNQAKNELDLMDFHEEGNYKEFLKGESHGHGKREHSLTTYEYEFQIGGFKALAKYNYCRDCAQVRNKVLTIFNEAESVCYQKWFKHYGKDPNSKDIVETARDIFANFVLLFSI